MNLNQKQKQFIEMINQDREHVLFQGGYFEGIRSHLGGLTQRVKSWYWGRPLVSCNTK